MLWLAVLRIGNNRYQIVEMNSSLSVSLYPPGESAFSRQQVWELDAHFVPADTGYTPPSDDQPEYFQLWMRAENYQVKDFRKISNFGLHDESDNPLLLATLHNRLAGNPSEELAFSLDEFTLQQSERLDDTDTEFLFDLHVKGVRRLPDGSELQLAVDTILPFKRITAYVPLNAPDPVKAAKAMAKKLLKLDQFAGSRVTPYNPAHYTSLISHINSHHVVTLQTPWA